MKARLIIGLFLLCFTAKAQLSWDGQVSGISSYSPDNAYSLFLGARYIPALNYTHALDSGRRFDFLASANLSASTFIDPFDSTSSNAQLNPYRLWARYAGKRFQLRLGLQKIDFGVATLLRPLQWFNQIDPRDPLALTNGVYGLMGRYFFQNNANIWLWGLYGNEKRRGFDLLNTNKDIPEWGGRLQLPINSGEIGFTYHHRNASANALLDTDSLDKIPESRYAIDIKVDQIIGLSLEATYIQKAESAENLNDINHQQLINIGIDYTFGLGNGLTLLTEHLIINSNETAFETGNTSHITALSLSYPLSFFDNISTLAYYSWTNETATVFINYQHQFSNFLGYVMAYYNPSQLIGIQQNDFVNNFSGPGIRLLVVFNH
jgi:hypothetical protein